MPITTAVPPQYLAGGIAYLIEDSLEAFAHETHGEQEARRHKIHALLERITRAEPEASLRNR